MITILPNMDPSISYALGWTIIHSFWQASLIALLMSLIHRIGNHKGATFKYGVSVVSMVSIFIISIITFAFYYTSSPILVDILADSSITIASISSGNEGVQLSGFKSFFANNLEHINLIWGVGVALFIARFVFSYIYTKYLRITAQFSNNVELEQILKRIKTNLFIDKAVAIAESAKIDAPLVLGHFKPLILFPIGIVNMLSTQEVEAIITHELAHIKRFDYLTNILLTMVEILFYFHPAVWWISANVKAERENCCDDFALSQNIDKVVYAKALVKLEEIKTSGTPSLAMPFSSKRHQLLNRIKRIMNMPQTQNDIKEKSIATIFLLSLVLLFNTQANSESTLHGHISNPTSTSDTLKLEGKNEMVLTVKEGKFESLEIDNEIIEGELFEKIAKAVNYNSDIKNSYTMIARENPILIFKDNEVNIWANSIEHQSDDIENLPNLRGDTIPYKGEANPITIFRDDGKKIEIEKKNGKVTMLKIDGKVIPKSEYDNYREELESVNEIYDLDIDENIFHLDGNDFSESFGMLFDGENWREFGGNFEHLLDSNLFKKLEDMEDMRFDFEGLKGLEELKKLEKLGELRGLKKLKEFEGLGNLKEFKRLEQLFEELGIKMDTVLGGMDFRFKDLEGLNGFEFFKDFEFDDDDRNIFKQEDSSFKRGTVVDKIGKMLNKDGLLKEYKSNEVEITGKHLKINGEKMPKVLFEKYKNIYQESTGAPLTKKSKMVFNIEGKPSRRKVKTF